jgi:hypothetical protein
MFLVIMDLLNSRTIFQQMHYKLSISYVIMYVRIKKNPTNTTRQSYKNDLLTSHFTKRMFWAFELELEQTTFFTTSSLINVMWIWIYSPSLNFEIIKKIEKKLFNTHVCIVHYALHHIYIIKEKSNSNGIIIFNCEILELTLNNLRLIQSFFPWSWGFNF